VKRGLFGAAGAWDGMRPRARAAWSSGPSTSPLGASGKACHDARRCGLLHARNHTVSGAARDAHASIGRIPTARAPELSAAVRCHCVRTSLPDDPFSYRWWNGNGMPVSLTLYLVSAWRFWLNAYLPCGYSFALPVVRCAGGSGSPRGGRS